MFKITKPIIVVNFKTYEEASNDKALKLAKICEKISKNIVICADAINLKTLAENVKNPIFAQHVDGLDYGGHTGKILPEVIKHAGGKGSLINHSEDRYDIDELQKAIENCKKKGIFSIVCAQNTKEAKIIAACNPDAIAVELPELIGGNISITTANPKIILNTVKAVHQINPKIPVLCGAGVKNGNDVRKAIELGAMGVLLASGVTKSKNPKTILKDLNDGLD